MTARLWGMGRELHSRVRSFFDTPLEPSASPLELLQATLDALEVKVQPAGRGARIFPYNRIAIRIVQAGADRDAITAIFRQLEPRLRERLVELRCDAPGPIHIELTVAEPETDGHPVLSLECLDDQDVAGLEQAPRIPRRATRLGIAIVKGQAEQAEYNFTEPMIAIGRTAEPVDAHGNIRRNHVAFVDSRDGISETVARAHARLQRDPQTGEYHLFNEASSNPTAIVRGGRSIRVPPREPRGLRVQSGDEVQLGRAVIRLTID